MTEPVTPLETIERHRLDASRAQVAPISGGRFVVVEAWELEALCADAEALHRIAAAGRTPPPARVRVRR